MTLISLSPALNLIRVQGMMIFKYHMGSRFRAKWQAGVNWLSAGDCKAMSPSGLAAEFSLIFEAGKGD